MSSSPTNYFFDLAMADVNAISSSASRLLYHGSTHGAFGSYGFKAPTNSVDLHSIGAFSVSLEHLSNFPLSEEYDYQILYLSERIYSNLWNGCKKRNIPALKSLAYQARFATEAQLKPKTQRVFFSGQQSRTIAITPYDEGFNIGHHVPNEYSAAAKEIFKGFLLRSKKECTQLYALLESHGLKIVEQRNVLDDYDGFLQVRCYA